MPDPRVVHHPVPATGASGLSRGTAGFGLAILTLLNFVNYIDRYVLPAVAPRVKEALSLSDEQLGLVGSAFLLSYLFTSPAFGYLGDRFSRTRLMGLGVALWSVATAGAGLARSFAQMMVARGAVGVGEASYAAISPALLSDYYPRERRGRVFAVFYLAIPVGSAVGYLLGGLLEHHFGWRAAFFAVGLPGLLLALLTLTIADVPRGINDPPEARAEGSYGESLRALVRNRRYLRAVLGYAAYTFAVGGLSFWAPVYFSRERGLPLGRADLLVGGVSVVAGIGGTFAGGWLADRLATRVRQAYLYVSGVSMLLAMPLSWVALAARTPAVYVGALLLAEFMVFLSTGPINVVIVSVVPVAMRATAMAGSIFVIHLLGDAAAPWVVGALSDRIGMARAVLIMPLAIAASGVIWTAAAWVAARNDALPRADRL
ncbi:MAG TPA: MFS transporter [Vicinamibacteria bacterium]|nr:MFS transporter [Vicinamibacteria bacterium]